MNRIYKVDWQSDVSHKNLDSFKVGDYVFLKSSLSDDRAMKIIDFKGNNLYLSNINKKGEYSFIEMPPQCVVLEHERTLKVSCSGIKINLN